jgi:ribosomal protein S18 acetylase RimI-like enzyme
VPRSLVYATDIDVLPPDRIVERHEGHLAIRSPSNPHHYWGNLLLFDAPPAKGDAARWEQLFDAEFAVDPRVCHRTFGWDCTDGALGCAQEEFIARGYQLEGSVGLTAAADRVHSHPRENGDVVIRALDPAPGADEPIWDSIIELQVAGRDERFDEASHRTFSRRRLADLRALFEAGHGAWYVALDPVSDEPVAGCGIVVTDGRGRFQAVDTAVAYRRRGICSRLIVEAARHAAAVHGAGRFVIVADPDYHALGLYESLGFEPSEHAHGVCWWPRGPVG